MLLEDLKSVHIKDLKLDGLNAARKKVLYRLKLFTVFDVVTYFPLRYEDRKNVLSLLDVVKSIMVSSGGKVRATTIVQVVAHDYVNVRNSRVLKVIVSDGNLKGELICYNRNFLGDVLEVGRKFILSAVWEYKYNSLQSATFDYSPLGEDSPKRDEFGVVLPIYSASEGLRQRTIRKIVHLIVSHFAPQIEDELPEYILETRNILPLSKAVKIMHMPSKMEHVDVARKSIVYNEFIKMFLIIEHTRNEGKKIQKNKKYTSTKLADEFISSLPFELTSAQRRVLHEIKTDMFSDRVMQRLVQGDVGSGKTIVAIYAMLIAVENGYQSAFMVPTEVLATQHYLSLLSFLGKFSETHKINIRLLKGEMSAKTRKLINLEAELGKAHIIVGTHALFQEGVKFKKLGLVVIDEQHKFGVEQRALVISKGNNPDVLFMTATPIPRTLTMTLYGSLDVSIIDEMPMDRKPIITKWFKENDIEHVYRDVIEHVRKGFKVYFVCPLIEESDSIDVRSVVELYEHLSRDVFREIPIGLLHGRMSSEEKYQVMEAFRSGKIKILVSTSVIEVGIDVKDATLIVIEGADRFGLAQLHQLRGRVGRGPYQSYCYLVTPEKISENAAQRMKIMVRNQDGFSIAQKDLELRGPGEIIGYEQSGLPNFILADLIRDEELLLLAKKDAQYIFAKDPDLQNPKNKKIISILKRHSDKSTVVKS